jgi:hypothetical protein
MVVSTVFGLIAALVADRVLYWLAVGGMQRLVAGDSLTQQIPEPATDHPNDGRNNEPAHGSIPGSKPSRDVGMDSWSRWGPPKVQAVTMRASSLITSSSAPLGVTPHCTTAKERHPRRHRARQRSAIGAAVFCGDLCEQMPPSQPLIPVIEDETARSRLGRPALGHATAGSGSARMMGSLASS